jgi:pilus assembly protein Flp/PilA
MSVISRFVREDEGQDLVEYAMLVALIAIICVAGVGALGLALNGFYDSIDRADGWGWPPPVAHR